MPARPVFVVAGIGNGTSTGASSARVFAQSGYRVALIARNPEHLKQLAEEITSVGGEAAAFLVKDYAYKTVQSVFDTIAAHSWPSAEKSEVRVALWNASGGAFKKFFDVTEADIAGSVEGNITAPFAFARQAITAFRKNETDNLGRRGTLLFTGATASVRGNVTTSSFSAGKHALRALTQSLAKEFGQENIHVAHIIIDGVILTNRSIAYRDGDTAFKANEDIRLNPDSIAQSYLYLTNQDRTSWTWELDLRPAHEKW